jgi:diamine N-acetyltransferase
MTIIIRKFESKDTVQIADLMETFDRYIQSLDETKRTIYQEGSAQYFTNKMINLTQEKQGVIYVACNGNKIIGFISGHKENQDDDEQMETIPANPGIVEELFVSKEYRGQRIGKNLLEKMENYLKTQGCDIVKLSVFAPNISSRKFYKYFGYEERIVSLLKKI